MKTKLKATGIGLLLLLATTAVAYILIGIMHLIVFFPYIAVPIIVLICAYGLGLMYLKDNKQK